MGNIMSVDLAPITLFVYNRPDHVRKAIKSLAGNALAGESNLIIFSDGAKDDSDATKVSEVRRFLHRVDGFKSVKIVERAENHGLSRSIITGVTEICNVYGRVIVLEDDLVLSPYFLKYMNDALTLYRDDDKVISIHGYLYPIKAVPPETFFLKGADCWGWATWKRGWDLFESNGALLLQEIRTRGLEKEFDMGGVYPYTHMLKQQVKGNNDSWAVRWYASAFLNDKLTLYPGRSLVYNIGNDNTGTHCSQTNIFDTEIVSSDIHVHRIVIKEDRESLGKIADFLKTTQPSTLHRIKNTLKNAVRRMQIHERSL
jgi:glycosyltransferase involved in cell wall biosynthesis